MRLMLRTLGAAPTLRAVAGVGEATGAGASPDRRHSRRSAAAQLFGCGLTGALAIALAFPALGLGGSSIRRPYNYDLGIDVLFYGFSAKTLIDGDKSLLDTPELGAPFGLNLRDFPLGADNANHALV